MTANPPPFAFQPRRGAINWRLVARVDPDRVASTMDLDALQSVLETITFSDLTGESLRYYEEDFHRLFRLSQLSLEYLLHAQDHLSSTLSRSEDAAAKLKKENARLRKKLAAAEKGKPAARGAAAAGAGHDCAVCPKRFATHAHLVGHYSRRHPNASAPGQQRRGVHAAESEREAFLEAQIAALTGEVRDLRAQVAGSGLRHEYQGRQGIRREGPAAAAAGSSTMRFSTAHTSVTDTETVRVGGPAGSPEPAVRELKVAIEQETNRLRSVEEELRRQLEARAERERGLRGDAENRIRELQRESEEQLRKGLEGIRVALADGLVKMKDLQSERPPAPAAPVVSGIGPILPDEDAEESRRRINEVTEQLLQERRKRQDERSSLENQLAKLDQRLQEERDRAQKKENELLQRINSQSNNNNNNNNNSNNNSNNKGGRDDDNGDAHLAELREKLRRLEDKLESRPKREPEPRREPKPKPARQSDPAPRSEPKPEPEPEPQPEPEPVREPVREPEPERDLEPVAPLDDDFDPNYRMPKLYTPIPGRPYIFTRYDHRVQTVMSTRGSIADELSLRRAELCPGTPASVPISSATFAQLMRDLARARSADGPEVEDVRRECRAEYEDYVARFGPRGSGVAAIPVRPPPAAAGGNYQSGRGNYDSSSRGDYDSAANFDGSNRGGKFDSDRNAAGNGYDTRRGGSDMYEEGEIRGRSGDRDGDRAGEGRAQDGDLGRAEGRRGGAWGGRADPTDDSGRVEYVPPSQRSMERPAERHERPAAGKPAVGGDAVLEEFGRAVADRRSPSASPEASAGEPEDNKSDVFGSDDEIGAVIDGTLGTTGVTDVSGGGGSNVNSKVNALVASSDLEEVSGAGRSTARSPSAEKSDWDVDDDDLIEEIASKNSDDDDISDIMEL